MSVRGVLSAVLGFEVVVLWLFVPVAMAVGGYEARVALPLAVGLGLLCIVAIALLRGPYGVVVGSAVQVLAIALGLFVPAMFFLGAVFALLWFVTLRLGRDIERIRREREGGAAAG